MHFIELLRSLSPTALKGFEGLVAQLLSDLTGRRFFLARSGFQAGRDMTSDRTRSTLIAVECKLRKETTPLNERTLLGGIEQASQDLPDLDLWVLATTRSVPDHTRQAMWKTCKSKGISLAILDCQEDPLPRILVLCAFDIETTVSFVEHLGQDPSAAVAELQAIASSC